MGPLDVAQKKLRPPFRPNLFLATLIFFGNPQTLGPGFTIPNFTFLAPFSASLEQKVDFARSDRSLGSHNFKRLQLSLGGSYEGEILYRDSWPIYLKNEPKLERLRDFSTSAPYYMSLTCSVKHAAFNSGLLWENLTPQNFIMGGNFFIQFFFHKMFFIKFFSQNVFHPFF